jgi:hypothetical protein
MTAKQFQILTIVMLLTCISAFSQKKESMIRENVPLDSIRLSDPFILADKNSLTYYMTGPGNKNRPSVMDG